MKCINSPVQKVNFSGFELFIKRDDLLNVEFSGNKARKFHFYLENDFPKIKKLISHGSVQSNAMYSLSVLCRLKGWEFLYYVKKMPSLLIEQPMGNYKNALVNGMTLVENASLPKTFDEETLFIPEGGALLEAQWGIKHLAQELITFAQEEALTKLEIFLPSGTGTTALFLQKNVPFRVLTCACVGDESYLKKQFTQLVPEEKYHPTVLGVGKKYHFGTLYEEFYTMHKKAKEQTGLEFDLLYDSLGLMTLKEYWQHNPTKTILYVHQGGLLGNETMLSRYKRKNYFTI